MKYWRSAILCGLLVCLGCGTFTHSRVARPLGISPPFGRPTAPNPAPGQFSPGQPSSVTPAPVPMDQIPPNNGPSFDGKIGKKHSTTRISKSELEKEDRNFNPPPKSGYIELPPPPKS